MDIEGTVPTTYGTKKDTDVYDRFSKDHAKKNLKCEIIVWNLQKDLIDLFSIKPPWKVPIFRRFVAHDDSIVSLAYMAKAQLLVSSSVDKSIRFWDPATTQYDLADPAGLPVSAKCPGNYRPLKPEQTMKNQPYREVRRVYTRGNICFALQPLRIKNVVLNPAQPSIKSSCEWIICLSFGKPLPYHSTEAKAA
jgi:WD40 repeat protein